MSYLRISWFQTPRRLRKIRVDQDNLGIPFTDEASEITFGELGSFQEPLESVFSMQFSDYRLGKGKAAKPL